MGSEDRDAINQLVSRFQSGVDREESFRLIYQRFYGPIHRVFRRRGFSADESYDLTQETFLRILRSVDAFRGDSSFEAWIYGVVRNTYTNELRRRGAEKRDAVERSLDTPLYEEGPSLGDYLPSADEGPLDELLKTEKREALRLAFQNLPPQMRMCCTLRYERGLNYQEIATIAGISIETVKAHLFQAKGRLAAKLREEFE